MAVDAEGKKYKSQEDKQKLKDAKKLLRDDLGATGRKHKKTVDNMFNFEMDFMGDPSKKD